jgi:hypothetical protein
MSRQSEAKESQNYTREIKNCSNCRHFSCDTEKQSRYVVQRNLRCGIGGFKIHKTALCDFYILRDPT